MNRFSLVCLASAAIFLVAGCGKGKFSSTSEEQKPNVLRYALKTIPTDLDPALVQDGDTIDLLQNVFEGLTAWSEENKPVGNLATNWDISADGRTYTFHLKKGVKFFNGREVTADDVAFSLNRSANRNLGSQTAENYLNDIVGFRDVWDGKAKEMAGIKVIDPATISITIDKARPYFLGKLTYPTGYVVAKEVVGDKKITDIKQMVGTGPFIPTEYQDGVMFKLKANKDYHNGAPLIDGIERPIMKDNQTKYLAYKRGELDILALERRDVAAVKEDPELTKQLKYYQRPSIYYVGMNLKMIPQFGDRRVRQAIAMAIDKDKIVNDVLGGQNVRADTIIPPGVPGHRDKGAGFEFNVEKARQLLAQAGYPGGKGFPAIKIAYRDGQADVQYVSENVAGQLHENLGLNVGQEQIEWGAYLDRNNKKQNPIFHMRWAADYLDPQNFISLLLSTTGNENKIYYSNPQVDALCAKADADMNEQERLGLYAQAEDLVLQDAPWVPIYFQRDAELISPRIKSGLRDSLFGHLPHYKLELAK